MPPTYKHSLPQYAPQVIGTDLNCSESTLGRPARRGPSDSKIKMLCRPLSTPAKSRRNQRGRGILPRSVQLVRGFVAGGGGRRPAADKVEHFPDRLPVM